MKPLSTLYLVPMLFAATVTLSGCPATVASAKPEPTVQYETRLVDTSCQWLPVLTFSSADTAETKRGIIAYATARKQHCAKQ